MTDLPHSKMISEAQLIDNHSLIDPVALKYERSDPEYQPERKRVVWKTDLIDSLPKITETTNTAH